MISSLCNRSYFRSITITMTILFDTQRARARQVRQVMQELNAEWEARLARAVAQVAQRQERQMAAAGEERGEAERQLEAAREQARLAKGKTHQITNWRVLLKRWEWHIFSATQLPFRAVIQIIIAIIIQGSANVHVQPYNVFPYYKTKNIYYKPRI
jgi:hypothetical protein